MNIKKVSPLAITHLPEVPTKSEPRYAGIVEKIVQRKIAAAQRQKEEKEKPTIHEIRKHKRNLELLRKPLLSVSIRLEAGRGLSMKFSFKHLGLKKEHIQKIRERKLNEPTMPVFEELKAAHGRLAYERKKVIALMQDMEGQKVFPEEEWLSIIKPAIAELEQKTEDEKRWVLSQYIPGLRSFLLGILEILQEIELTPEECEYALDLYAAKFPPAEEIAERLKIVVIGPIRIPSLAEQARYDAELKEAENRLIQADLERQALSIEERMATEAEYSRRKLIQEEELAVKRAISENLERVAKNFDATLKWAKEEVLSVVAEQLADIEQKADDGKVGAAPKGRLLRLLDRMDELICFIPGDKRELQSLVEETAKLGEHFTKSKNEATVEVASQNIKTTIERIRTRFNTEFDSISLGEEDEGHWGARIKGIDI